MGHGFPNPDGAMHRAIIEIGQTIRAQATIMGYADCFGLIGGVLLIAVVAVAMLRKGTSAGGAAHWQAAEVRVRWEDPLQLIRTRIMLSSPLIA
jgi:hypothetical protein